MAGVGDGPVKARKGEGERVEPGRKIEDMARHSAVIPYTPIEFLHELETFSGGTVKTQNSPAGDNGIGARLEGV